MDHSTALFDQVSSLFSFFDEPDTAVADALVELTGDLITGIASYRGLQLTLLRDGYPIVLTAFPDRSPGGGTPVRTSLGLPLQLLDPHLEIGGRVVFYAGAAGALTQLAGHLRAGLTGGTTHLLSPTPARGPVPVIDLDLDLPPSSLTSGLTGLEELSIINRAIGLLIDRGHHPDEVGDTLRRQAGPAGLPPHVYASQLLTA